MDKDNIRENENLNEEIEEKEVNPVEPELTEEENFEVAEESETADEEITEAPEESETADEEIIEDAEESETADEEIAEAVDEEIEEIAEEEAGEVEPLSEEEIEAIRIAKKKKTKKILLSCGIVAIVVLLVLAWFGSVEGFWEKNVVTTPMMAESGESAREDNIKYTNPVVSAFDFITGRNRDAAMTVNGAAVDKDIFTYMTNNMAIQNVYTQIQMGLIDSIDNFDWNAIDETSGLSHIEYAKGMAVQQFIPIYALIAEAEEHGITLDENDKKAISDKVDGYKKEFGGRFEEVLLQNGYPNEETLVAAQTSQTLMGKVYDDAAANIENYVKPEDILKNEDEEKVTVKHILIAFDDSGLGDESDEKKAEAKKLAEEVLAKVKAGEDFDKLIEEYNDDPGVTAEGYTFADNGQMVQEFTDAAFALEVGETSELVETSYGYHIVKRLERNITIDDYILYLQKTADVRIKRFNFSDIEIILNLEDFFGAASAE